MVIVDNGSTDESRSIIASFEDRLPLTYVFEPKAGKNTALNTGLASVSGDLVVLTDDDAFPRTDWLVRLREVADSRPTFGIFGGVVLPRWETEPPAWFLKWVQHAPACGISNTNQPEGPTNGHHLFGPNMAVRAEIFQAGHRFDQSIGPTSSPSYAMGSETEFTLRMIRQGVRAWYAPTAMVDHLVRKTQMQRSWLLRRAMRFGRGQCRLALQLPPCSAGRCFGIPLYLLYQIARKAAGVLVAILLFDRQKLFHRRWVLSYVCGYALEARASSKGTVAR